MILLIIFYYIRFCFDDDIIFVYVLSLIRGEKDIKATTRTKIDQGLEVKIIVIIIYIWRGGSDYAKPS
jgi:hypothetical protein